MSFVRLHCELSSAPLGSNAGNSNLRFSQATTLRKGYLPATASKLISTTISWVTTPHIEVVSRWILQCQSQYFSSKPRLTLGIRIVITSKSGTFASTAPTQIETVWSGCHRTATRTNMTAKITSIGTRIYVLLVGVYGASVSCQWGMLSKTKWLLSAVGIISKGLVTSAPIAAPAIAWGVMSMTLA